MAYLRCGSGGGLKEEILWTNPNPTSSIGAVTIECDLSKYKMVLVKARYSTSNNSTAIFGINAESETLTSRTVCLMSMGQTSGTYVIRRTLSFSDNGTKINISDGVESGYNIYNIPIEIIGIK